MEIVLASSSPRRRELMALITPVCRVAVSDVDERAVTAPTPALLAGALAAAKCGAVADGLPGCAVVGCDTVVDVDGAVLGKPAGRADARRMLTCLSGRAHLVHTGVCVRAGALCEQFTVTSRVHFNPIAPEELEAYLETEEPYDKAGAYGIQGRAACFVSGIEGCYFNIMGLPVSRVYAALRAVGAL